MNVDRIEKIRQLLAENDAINKRIDERLERIKSSLETLIEVEEIKKISGDDSEMHF